MAMAADMPTAPADTLEQAAVMPAQREAIRAEWLEVMPVERLGAMLVAEREPLVVAADFMAAVEASMAAEVSTAAVDAGNPET